MVERVVERVVGIEVRDVRFPTSRERDGSDAMHPDPDYSAAYVIVRTDATDGHEGHGFAFTIGRGNEVQVAAIEALAPMVVGRPLDDLDDMGTVARTLTHDPQLRWLGPEKGVVHMAAGALVNALWDLKAKRAGLPLWRLLAGMTPEQIVDLVDFRYITDALTPDEALELLRRQEPTRAERAANIEEHGYPAYATSPGWLGYGDDKLRRLCKEAADDGFDLIKLKIGPDLDHDRHRLAIARDAVGPDVRLAVDANQLYDVGTAVQRIKALTDAGHGLWWVEEPTSPDDVLGYATIAAAVAPTPLAGGEHVQNRVVFKQLLQLGALGFLQLDATRVAGVNENVAILLLATKFGVPVCPHAGGVGLCELVQHLAMFGHVAVSGESGRSTIEYVDHLHEHFVDPVVVERGRYRAPVRPGFSSEMRPESLARYSYPGGPAWAEQADAS